MKTINSQDNVQSEISDEIPEMLEENHSNSQLEETLYPINSEDEKEPNLKNDNSELSKKSTGPDDNKKEDKKNELNSNESKKLFEKSDLINPKKRKISSEKKRIKIKKKLSLSLKNYLKKELKKKIARKNIKIAFNKKEIIHKLIEIVKKFKIKSKIHILKDILHRYLNKISKNFYKFKSPKKLSESENINIINYFSDSFDDIFFWKIKPYDKEEILSSEQALIMSDISCNKKIYNKVANEDIFMINDELTNHFPPPLSILPNTNYKTNIKYK